MKGGSTLKDKFKSNDNQNRNPPPSKKLKFRSAPETNAVRFNEDNSESKTTTQTANLFYNDVNHPAEQDGNRFDRKSFGRE